MISLEKIKAKALVVVWCALIFSCNDHPTTIINNVMATKTLNSENVPAITEVSIKKLGMVDTTMVVVNGEENKDSVLSFYSLKTLNRLAAIGRYGLSPVEFKSPKYDNQFYTHGKGGTNFLIPDANNYNIRTFNLTAVLKGKAGPEKEMMLPPQLVLRYNSIWLTKDSVLIGNYRSVLKSKPYRFFFYDLKSKKLDWIKNYPVIAHAIENDKTATYYTSFCAFNEELQVFGSAMHYFKRVDFIGFDQQRKVQSVFADVAPDSIRTSSNILTDNKAHIYYTSSFAGKNYFYATCADVIQKDYLDNKGKMQFHIFNWDGTLYKNIKLDQMSLGHFIVDEKNQTLYIVNFSKNNHKTPVIKYNLNQ